MTQPELFESGESATPAAATHAAQGAAAECSADALGKVDAKTIEQYVREEYERRPAGATADEVYQVVRFRIPGPMVDELSIRPRVAGLKKEGILVDTGKKRYNRKGNLCAVLIHKKFIQERTDA